MFGSGENMKQNSRRAATQAKVSRKHNLVREGIRVRFHAELKYYSHDPPWQLKQSPVGPVVSAMLAEVDTSLYGHDLIVIS